MHRYLALGDSYTIGEGVDPTDAWPQRLAELLEPMQFHSQPDVVACTGWTTDELLAMLDAAVLSPPYRLVSLLIGVNDQYRGREVAEHLPHFNRLLNQAVGYADGNTDGVLVVSIPDWSVSEFGAADQRGRAAIAADIDAFNAAQRELCELRGIAYADITPLSRAVAGEPGMFVGDGLHPSRAQYARWLDVITPVARHCLEPISKPI